MLPASRPFCNDVAQAADQAGLYFIKLVGFFADEPGGSGGVHGPAAEEPLGQPAAGCAVGAVELVFGV